MSHGCRSGRGWSADECHTAGDQVGDGVQMSVTRLAIRSVMECR